MDSVRANLNVPPAITPTAGAIGAPIAAAPAAAPSILDSAQSQLGLSQQMLQSLVQLESQWTQSMGSPGLSSDLNSLEQPLSGSYQGMLFGSPGQANNLDSLMTPLRGGYSGMLAGGAGASDNYNMLGMPLSGMYQGMMMSLDMQMAQASAQLNASAPPAG